MFTDKNFIDRIVVNREKIKIVDLNHLTSENIPDALASEMIQADILKNFFEMNAFNHFKKIIERKRRSVEWTCKMCKGELGTGDSIECDKCLFWSHWTCVNLFEEPANHWFCANCQSL